MTEQQAYRWPDLSGVQRQYIVTDDQGRMGVARDNQAYDKDTIFAHPIDVGDTIDGNGVRFITSTPWTLQPDGTYEGIWYDYSGPSHVPPEMLRRLSIVSDLGYKMPDYWAERALAGSDQDGHWDYGATLGKIGGKPPVNGQRPGEMCIAEAVAYALDVGERATPSGIRVAASRGDIPGARKSGRDWLIPYDGYNHYLDNRPKPGRKAQKPQVTPD